MLSALKKDNGRRDNPGGRFLSNAPFRKREAQAFPPTPSEGRVARTLLSAHDPHRRRSQGIPKGCNGRKLNSIIDAHGAPKISVLYGGNLMLKAGCNRLLCQRRHDSIPCLVRMQAIIG